MNMIVFRRRMTETESSFRVKCFRCAWLASAVCVAVLALFSSCSKVEPKEVAFEERSKTLLLYFASHNNLAVDAASNINKIVNGYLPDDANIVIYSNNFDLKTFQMKDTLPVLVNMYKDKNGNRQLDTLYKFPYQNSCTKNAMKSVLNITKTMCPATSYGLVLWSHGTGWLPTGYYTLDPSTSEDEAKREAAYARLYYGKKEPLSGSSSAGVSTAATSSGSSVGAVRNGKTLFPEPENGVDPYAHMVKSFGSESRVEMSIFDVQEALGDTHFDFIAIDACLMGGIEIAYQLRNSCDYFISSPAEMLTDSFPYDKVIEKMVNGDYNGVSKEVYDYYAAQSGEYRSVTISTVKCSELEAVAEEASKLFDIYRDGIASLDVTTVQRYFRFNDHWFYDLKDFLDNLCGSSETAAFTSALQKAVTAKYTTGQMITLAIDPAKFSGLSCYINNPEEATLTTYYQKYDWNSDVKMIVPDSSSE